MVIVDTAVHEGWQHERKAAGDIPDEAEQPEGVPSQVGKFVGKYHGTVKRQCRDKIEKQLPKRKSRCLQCQYESGPAKRGMKKKIHPGVQSFYILL